MVKEGEPSEGAGDRVLEDKGAALPADKAGEGGIDDCGAAYTEGDKCVFASLDGAAPAVSPTEEDSPLAPSGARPNESGLDSASF